MFGGAAFAGKAKHRLQWKFAARSRRGLREPFLNCPICEKRKAKRFCPAKGESICSLCCGTEREVTIDCPGDCPHLVASRRYDQERRPLDWSKVPFPEVRIPSSFVAAHEKFLASLSYAICAHAREHAALVDTDVVESLAKLAEAYRTLSSGLIYEQPPEYLLQRQLYDRLKGAIDEYRKSAAGQLASAALRDGEVRDALVFMTQLGATRSNGRPKSRAYLDFLRAQFKTEEFSKPAPSLLIP